MISEKILEMIESGELEELKNQLRDDIYKKSLKNNGTAEKRYKAMKRYFKNTKDTRKEMQKPCKNVSVNGKNYICFLDSVCIALTTEDIGNIKEYDNSENTYFRIEEMFKLQHKETIITNVSEILALAKSKGYKYKKSECDTGQNFEYVLKIKDSYIKIGLLDKAFSIINDGNSAELYYTSSKHPIILKNDIGLALILPVYCKNGKIEEEKTVIDIEQIEKK